MKPKKKGILENISVYRKAHLNGILWTSKGNRKPWWIAALSNKRIAVVLSALLLFVMSGVAFARHFEMQKVNVILNDDGNAVQLITMEKTVGDVLKKYGIELKEEDKLVPSADQAVEKGMEINIRRAMSLLVTADDGPVTVALAEGTVGDAIKKAGILLRDSDEVVPAVTTEISPGLHIQITRVDEKIITETQAIPYKVVTKKDDTLKSGTQKVSQSGSQGEREKKFRLVYKDGQEVSKTLISEQVIKKPVDKVVLRGTKTEPKKVQQVASRGGTQRDTKPKTSQPSGGSISRGDKELAYRELIVMQATAYTYTGNKTATGREPARGLVAVDPRVIPLGTRLYVDGYGYALAADTGGGVKGNRIDLFMETASECFRFGRRSVRVYILK